MNRWRLQQGRRQDWTLKQKEKLCRYIICFKNYKNLYFNSCFDHCLMSNHGTAHFCRFFRHQMGRRHWERKVWMDEVHLCTNSVTHTKLSAFQIKIQAFLECLFRIWKVIGKANLATPKLKVYFLNVYRFLPNNWIERLSYALYGFLKLSTASGSFQ